MQLFWKKGYAETSVRDLVEATGVAHAGLYTAFEDKEGLYVAALAKYQTLAATMLYSKLTAPDAGLKSIVGFFEFTLAASKGEPFSNGCMMANTSVEFGTSNEKLQKLVLINLEKLSGAFRHALNGAVGKGELASDTKIDQLAASLTATFQGLSVLIRAGAPESTIAGAVAATLTQLK